MSEIDYAKFFEDISRRVSRLEEAMGTYATDLGGINAVLFGDARTRTPGLVDKITTLNQQLEVTQASIDKLIARMDKQHIEKEAVEKSQAQMWSSVKLWGSLATALIGIGQLVNIIINIKP